MVDHLSLPVLTNICWLIKFLVAYNNLIKNHKKRLKYREKLTYAHEDCFFSMLVINGTETKPKLVHSRERKGETFVLRLDERKTKRTRTYLISS